MQVTGQGMTPRSATVQNGTFVLPGFPAGALRSPSSPAPVLTVLDAHGTAIGQLPLGRTVGCGGPEPAAAPDS